MTKKELAEIENQKRRVGEIDITLHRLNFLRNCEKEQRNYQLKDLFSRLSHPSFWGDTTEEMIMEFDHYFDVFLVNVEQMLNRRLKELQHDIDRIDVKL